MKRGIVILLGFLLILPALATATVLTFEDIDTSVNSWNNIPDGYAGFNWFSMRVADPVGLGYTADDGSGLVLGIASGKQVAYNPYADWEVITSSSIFDFNGAYFTAAWNNGDILHVVGYLKGAQVYEKYITLYVAPSKYYTFNWNGIDQLGLYPSGVLYVMDNFTYNEPVPEPGTLMLLGGGLMGLVGYGRRRLKK